MAAIVNSYYVYIVTNPKKPLCRRALPIIYPQGWWNIGVTEIAKRLSQESISVII
jgi:hypothetical protein